MSAGTSARPIGKWSSPFVDPRAAGTAEKPGIEVDSDARDVKV